MSNNSSEVREFIAKNVATLLEEGNLVNLGAGIPTHVTNHVSKDINIMLHAECGLIGCGPLAHGDEVDYTLVDASTRPTTRTYDSVCFDSALSFGIIRGGHLDVSILGALEVDEHGNMANWIIPGKTLNGVGGAMDLCVGAKKLIVAMEHVTKKGEPKILKKCTLPLTCLHEVNVIVTDMAIIDITDKGMVLRAIAPGLTVEDVQKNTGVDLIIPDIVGKMVS